MKVFIRTDASVLIGSGHVMRCMALAEKLRAQNAEVKFICRELLGNYVGKLRKKGFVVECFSVGRTTTNQERYAQWLGADWETDAAQTRSLLATGSPVDWLVTDHYSIDKRWEKELRGVARSILTIDDLADRSHDCDILLDQNRIGQQAKLYGDLVPAGCRILLGPTYALLRPEFAEKRAHLRLERKGEIRILVFWGGVDQSNETGKTLEALQGIDVGKVSISVVVGGNNPHRSSLEDKCHSMQRVSFHFDVDNMADLIFETDLAVGAPGVSSWERCCLGVPTIMASIAENQVPVGEVLNAKGAGVFLGPAQTQTPGTLRKSILELINNDQLRRTMSQRASSLVDGLGAARIVEAMLEQQ